MAKLLKKISAIFAAIAVCSVLVTAVAPERSYAYGDNAKAEICNTVQCSGGGSIDKILKAVVQIISVLAGVITVIMIVISGIKFATSGGDSSKVASARSSLMYALVGLVVTVLAQVIVRFVLTKTV